MIHPTGNNRRDFLGSISQGLCAAGLASVLCDNAGQLAADDLVSPSHALSPRPPHMAGRARSVIQFFMTGGPSQVDLFDPKPALRKHQGELPRGFIDNVESVAAAGGLLPSPFKFSRHGNSGLPFSELLPHLSSCADEIAVIRSMWTTDNNHGAQLEFLSGRHLLDGCFPTVGAWIHYGLGSLSDNLPQFLSIGDRGMESQCAGGTDAQYLGPEHEGIWLTVDPKNPLAYASSAATISKPVQAIKRDLLSRLQARAAREYASDEKLRARIKSYDLAFRMQTAIPDIMNLDSETRHTHSLYGLDNSATRRFGQQLLATRRLVEKGVRFVQVFHGGGAAGAWDAHANLIGNHDRMCGQADKPIAGLLSDLKQRGMLEDTVVVWTSEFGRTPGVQGKNGRDHHNYGFSVWMAGGGIKGGVVHGATDELGFHAVENRHYVTDVHATLFRLLGLDARRLEIPGRKRLEIDFGESIDEIIA